LCFSPPPPPPVRSTPTSPPETYTLSLHDALPIFLPMRILSCGAQIAALVLAASTALAQTPAQTLTVYTYDSFTAEWGPGPVVEKDRKSTRLNSSHVKISYAVFCLKKKKRSKSQHH